MPRLILALLLVTVLFGGPYAAALMDRVMGPWESTAIHADGGSSHTVFDANLPRPEWVPMPAGATIVQSTLTTTGDMAGFGSLDVATRMELDALRGFYREALERSGFRVSDDGIGPLNPLTAQMLGMAAMLSAERAATRDRVDIQIRTPEGIIPARLVQMHWCKLPAPTN